MSKWRIKSTRYLSYRQYVATPFGPVMFENGEFITDDPNIANHFMIRPKFDVELIPEEEKVKVAESSTTKTKTTKKKKRKKSK
ncbi:MAG: hypothetical protein ACTSRP_02055 [Candidatus Helarchaeota archaeon]